VLATEATVSLHAYGNAIRALDRSASVQELPCEMLVALAEEGWSTGAIAEAIVRQYLQPFLSGEESLRAETIILGCTHFPILRDAIRAVAGDAMPIVDSAGTTATAVEELLHSAGLLRAGPDSGKLDLLATDGARRFARVGGRFLGSALSPEDVRLVDL
jgi:glutamate racemase